MPPRATEPLKPSDKGESRAFVIVPRGSLRRHSTAAELKAFNAPPELSGRVLTVENTAPHGFTPTDYGSMMRKTSQTRAQVDQTCVRELPASARPDRVRQLIIDSGLCDQRRCAEVGRTCQDRL